MSDVISPRHLEQLVFSDLLFDLFFANLISVRWYPDVLYFSNYQSE